MPTIIRDRSAVSGATLEDLNHTYRALKGDPGFKGFASRAAAEVQVQMAIMAAQDAAGHAGVPKGAQIHNLQPLTPAELAHKNPYKEGTMSHKLHEAIQQQQPIEPRPKASPATPAQKRTVINRVMATLAGDSKPQTGSVRNQVLIFIQQCENHTCTVAELEAHFQRPVRGYLQKLIEKNHLVVIEDDIK